MLIHLFSTVPDCRSMPFSGIRKVVATFEGNSQETKFQLKYCYMNDNYSQYKLFSGKKQLEIFLFFCNRRKTMVFCWKIPENAISEKLEFLALLCSGTNHENTV